MTDADLETSVIRGQVAVVEETRAAKGLARAKELESQEKEVLRLRPEVGEARKSRDHS